MRGGRFGKVGGPDATALRGRGEEVHTEEKSGEGEDDGLDCDENMEENSMVVYYCKVLLLKEYHSNETGGSCGF